MAIKSPAWMDNKPGQQKSALPNLANPGCEKHEVISLEKNSSMDQKLLLLKRHPLADGVTEDEVLTLADACELIEFETGQFLHSSDDSLDLPVSDTDELTGVGAQTTHNVIDQIRKSLSVLDDRLLHPAK